MKEVYVVDLKNKSNLGEKVVLSGWVKNKRDHGKILFIEICDSTGCIQSVIKFNNVSQADWISAKKITLESSIKVCGIMVSKDRINFPEILVNQLVIIGLAKIKINPRPRSKIHIFEPNLQEQLLKHRHMYLRNDKTMAILKFRHLLLSFIRNWFDENRFIEITAPILTSTPLYDDRSAISLDIQNQKVFLTQCVGFYLESAVHAFERVYNIGPSFRGEESRSKRHLMEYWHIKAEVAFANFGDIKFFVEKLISDTTKFLQEKEEVQELISRIGTKFCSDGLLPPYPCIKYSEVVLLLQKEKRDFEFGKSLGSEEESFLSSYFSKPFWITGIPRSIEPFPYVIDSTDSRVTKTADLIATNGFGELLGIAEKIYDFDELEERMKEKEKIGKPEYGWVKDLRLYGGVPHGGFGMGVERFIRWLINIPHVRDTIPFSRTFNRKIYP